jgi:hypothetical protein
VLVRLSTYATSFRQLAINLRYPREALLGSGASLTVVLVILISFAPKEWLRRFVSSWFCSLPTIAVIGMYLLVHLVQRFVLGFSLVLWGTVLAAVIVPTELQVVARRALLAGIIVFMAYSVPGMLHYVFSPPSESVERDITIANAISRYGIHPGDQVASVGNGQEAYWAYFAKVSVVAEVWSIDIVSFASERTVAQNAALGAMAESGAKAVVWRADLDLKCPPFWISLPSDSGCLKMLR